VVFDRDDIGDLLWEGERTVERNLVGERDVEVFSDGKWKLRAIERRKGPFACIRRIERVGNRFYAYDDRGEFLLELDPKGAHDISLRRGLGVEKVDW
jgi:hypothetical protein